MNLHAVLTLSKDTFVAWRQDNASRSGAALAFFAIFSIVPLATLTIAVAGFVFGEAAAQGQVVIALANTMGEETALFIQNLITSVRHARVGIGATVVSVFLLFYGASNIFHHLRGVINDMWKTESSEQSIVRGILKDRLISLVLAFVIGLLLLLFLVAGAGIAALGRLLDSWLPGGAMLWQLVELAVSFLGITVLLAAVYKILPAARIAWNDVWIGSVVTALLLILGKFLIGLYITNSNIGSVYGATGSLILLLIWIYYSAQLFFFGAEFTHLYANRFGSRIVSKATGRPVKKKI